MTLDKECELIYQLRTFKFLKNISVQALTLFISLKCEKIISYLKKL